VTHLIVRIPAEKVAAIIETIQAEIECIEFSHTDHTDGRIHDTDVLEEMAVWETLLEALGGERPAKYVPP
jgi:hypothetical protein